MATRRPTITIGIPAYNEEANIIKLLEDISTQDQHDINIAEIIVTSDGSTDSTVSRIRGLKNKHITLIANRRRVGIARGLNQILSRARGSIVVILDADVRILDRDFISKLVSPIIAGRADFCSSNIRPFPPRTLVAQLLDLSMRIKNTLFESYNNGDNLYTCHGLARAFSKTYARKLKFPSSIGNDMYSYLECVRTHHIYEYVRDAYIYYYLPKTYADHTKQSVRFFNSDDEQSKYFTRDFVQKHTYIPLSAYIKTLVLSIPILITRPIHAILYAGMCVYIRASSHNTEVSDTWDIAVSSKSD